MPVSSKNLTPTTISLLSKSYITVQYPFNIPTYTLLTFSNIHLFRTIKIQKVVATLVDNLSANDFTCKVLLPLGEVITVIIPAGALVGSWVGEKIVNKGITIEFRIESQTGSGNYLTMQIEGEYYE